MKEEKMPLIMKHIVWLKFVWQWSNPTDKNSFRFIGTHCISYCWLSIYCLSPNITLQGLLLVLSSKTDFFVDMSGQISSRRRQLLTKQWSGNKCSDVPTKSTLRITRWIVGAGWVNSAGLSVKHAVDSLDRAVFANSRAFLKAYFIYIFMYPFFFFLVHYCVDKP